MTEIIHHGPYQMPAKYQGTGAPGIFLEDLLGLTTGNKDIPDSKERIEAWPHGPVIPDLYSKYKGFGAGAIEVPDGIDFSKFDKPTKSLLNQVYQEYGQFSAWKLRDMSHNEPPWIASQGNAEIAASSRQVGTPRNGHICH